MPDRFDLIAVNIGLHWISDFYPDRSPRTVLLQFLRLVQGLLKKDGILVAGAVNRFARSRLRALVRGRLSSITEPQRDATRGIDRFSDGHQPRPTYSEKGYRKLFSDAGFTTECYWAYPGYERPYSLVPLVNRFVQERFIANLLDPTQVLRRDKQRPLKIAAAKLGILRWVVPEFLILAQKRGTSRSSPGQRFWKLLEPKLPADVLVERPLFALSTYAFSRKNIVFVSDERQPRPSVILKTSTAVDDSATAVRSEFRKLSLVSSTVQDRADGTFVVPRPLAAFKIGNFEYAAESPAAWLQFSRALFSRPRSGWLEYLNKHLSPCIEAAVQVARVLRGERAIGTVDPKWWSLPVELERDKFLEHELDGLGRPPELDHADCVQHGDFTVENVFIDGDAAPHVIDWEHLIRGVPPLYDVFSFLLSLIPAAIVECRSAATQRQNLEPQFVCAFFGKGRVAQLFEKTVLMAAERMAVRSANSWRMFLQFLVLRTNYHWSRNSPQAQEHVQYLRVALQHRQDFIVRATSGRV
jgi:hypothetical protein